jgi:rod shape-determining protein MreD
MVNWRRNLFLTILYLAAFFLQYGVLNNLGWGIFCPQLLLFFPVYAGILRGSRYGLAHGLFCGLLLDLVIGRFIGLNMLVWGFTGYMVGRITKGLFKENYLIAVVSVFLVYLANCLLYAVLVGLISGHFFSMTLISRIVLGGALVNCFLSPIFYLPVYRSLLYGWLQPLKKQA